MLAVAPPQKIVGKRGSEVEARIQVSMLPGYHANSNTPSEDYLIPLRLTWTPGALEPAGIVYPKPRMEKYEFSPKPISVFSGKFEILSKFKAAATAPPGPGILTGSLRYQACNDKACFPPRTVEIQLPYSLE